MVRRPKTLLLPPSLKPEPKIKSWKRWCSQTTQSRSGRIRVLAGMVARSGCTWGVILPFEVLHFPQRHPSRHPHLPSQVSIGKFTGAQHLNDLHLRVRTELLSVFDDVQLHDAAFYSRTWYGAWGIHIRRATQGHGCRKRVAPRKARGTGAEVNGQGMISMGNRISQSGHFRSGIGSFVVHRRPQDSIEVESSARI